jgi:hypothetical protein
MAAVFSTREGVQLGFLAAGTQLERYSVVVSSAPCGGAIEIARGIPDNTCLGQAPARSPSERVQVGKFAGGGSA